MHMTIFDFVDEQISDYETREITIVDGWEFNQYETLKRAELYSNSRYEKGQYDSLNRRKPFFNIMTRLLNKQETAEDIDTKDIKLETTRPQHYAKSFAMSLLNKMWMRKVNFADTLNKMTKTRGRTGGVLVKKVMRDGTLDIDVVDWNNIISDPTDLYEGVKIERHFYTPASLIAMKKEGWGVGEFEGAIEQAISELAKAKQEREELDEERDSMGDYVQVFEVHGVLPTSMIDPEADEFAYSHQMHIIVRIGSGEDSHEGILYQKDNTEHPYKYLPYRTASRRDLGVGIVEEATEAQIWTNDAKKKEKDAQDFAGMVLLQSPDGRFKGKNVWKNMKNGTILEHTAGKPITGVNITPGGLQHFGNMVAEWDRQVGGATSVLDSNTGKSPASTTFRLGAIDNQEANSIFEKRVEEMGIFLGEVYRDWVIPYLKKLAIDEDYISAKFSPEEIKMLEKDYAQKLADKRVIKKYFAGEYEKLPPETKWIFIENDRETERLKAVADVRKSKHAKIKKDYFEDVEFELDVVVTNEQRIKQVYLETLSNILTTVAQNPNILNDPRLKKLFDQIMESAGYSPLEFDMIEQGAIDDIQLQEQQLKEGGTTNPIEAPQTALPETAVV